MNTVCRYTSACYDFAAFNSFAPSSRLPQCTNPSSTPTETPEARRAALADAIHESLTQPDPQQRAGEPQSIRELPNGAVIYRLPGTQSSDSSIAVHPRSTMQSSTRYLQISFRPPTQPSVSCRTGYRPWRTHRSLQNRTTHENIS